jgi:hypothetical protein
MFPTDFNDENAPKQLRIWGHIQFKLTGDFADENGNRFNYYDTKVLNIKFSCDQFSLERDYN